MNQMMQDGKNTKLTHDLKRMALHCEKMSSRHQNMMAWDRGHKTCLHVLYIANGQLIVRKSSSECYERFGLPHPV
ncbi:hypothetical protein NQ317_019312 [Molorchus minor]|uniref:Uncharacterized protein n=1 Tax=Molorchus minor TaxID=1323400 RepID=A0ABQ9J5P6_9CUCU|nr:hypothetical protein NQ317_019312 [Molorchus minor]